MGFSRRTAWDLEESGLARAVREARAGGATLIDMTVANPTVCGFDYGSGLLEGLREPRALVYDPDSRGLRATREAVVRYYADHGAQIAADEVVLTTSTSEAYSFLFRLLCDPGEEVLVGQPGYPLFDFLAGLDDVVLVNYPLFYDFGWWIDFAELERRISARTRALVVVHPNNPTGHATSEAERERLVELCARRGLALIVDEVFLDYGLCGAVESFARGPHGCLTFVVSGLSKVCGLPQMKVGWVAALGPGAAEALERLEVIADTFLSMNAPVQLAAAGWLEGREAIQRQILRGVKENLRVVEPWALPVEAGWCAVLRMPWRPGEMAERLVREAGIIVHPGSFYGMNGGTRVVVSLLGETPSFLEGAQKLKQWCEDSVYF